MKWNHYIAIYEGLISEDIDHKGSWVVEIGVYRGGSLRYFRNLIKGCSVLGVDINQRILGYQNKKEQIYTLACSQDNSMIVDNITSIIGQTAKVALIIDDASHVPELTERTLDLLSPLVGRDTWYVIEDLNNYRFSDSSRIRAQMKHCISSGGTIISSLNILAMKYSPLSLVADSDATKQLDVSDLSIDSVTEVISKHVHSGHDSIAVSCRDRVWYIEHSEQVKEVFGGSIAERARFRFSQSIYKLIHRR